MHDDGAKLSFREKAGYGIGDAAANFIFQTMLVFQLAFYTDTFGITAGAAGTLFLVVRFWDAIFDPMMGVIADRTKTKWGKFRPWVLWTAVPFGIVAFLAFTTPPFGPQGKLLYAYVTYIALMMVYSANNLPYSALSGVITGDLTERTSLSSYRFVFAMSAAFVIQGLALPMVNYFGQGDSAKGYQITMGIFAVLAAIFFVVTFATTKERVQPDPAQKSTINASRIGATIRPCSPTACELSSGSTPGFCSSIRRAAAPSSACACPSVEPDLNRAITPSRCERRLSRRPPVAASGAHKSYCPAKG